MLTKKQLGEPIAAALSVTLLLSVPPLPGLGGLLF